METISATEGTRESAPAAGVDSDAPQLDALTATTYRREVQTLESAGFVVIPPERAAGKRRTYLSEIFRIVEGATRGDMDKVRNYAGLLADKLEEDGEANSAKWLRQILEGKAGARIVPLDAKETK